jgi:two-component system, NarL family, nitrate/nitrite response regulator NarL
MFLALDPELEVAGEASNGAEGIEQVRQLEPDVELMDLLMPVADTLLAQRMRERAEKMGGTLTLESASNIRILIQVRIPLTAR